ncbi:hypothetical protein RCO48_38225 [Peribacillus frigoritolerans]|nr:hypothetical protein [Peribacillus frigoritolerans]
MKKFATTLPNSWPVENPLNAFWRKGSEFLRTLETVGKLAFYEFVYSLKHPLWMFYYLFNRFEFSGVRRIWRRRTDWFLLDRMQLLNEKFDEAITILEYSVMLVEFFGLQEFNNIIAGQLRLILCETKKYSNKAGKGHN